MPRRILGIGRTAVKVISRVVPDCDATSGWIVLVEIVGNLKELEVIETSLSAPNAPPHGFHLSPHVDQSLRLPASRHVRLAANARASIARHRNGDLTGPRNHPTVGKRSAWLAI